MQINKDNDSLSCTGKNTVSCASRWIVVWFACFFMGIALITGILPQKAFSETENRYLQQKPAFTTDAFLSGDFGEDYENYMADQFILRNQWIHLKTILELARGMQEINGVYIGTDGYLIEKTGASVFESRQAAKNIGFLGDFMDNLSKNQNLQSAQVMLVPTAEAVLIDKLPAYAPVYDQAAWIKSIENQCPPSSFVPVARNFEAMEKDRLYYYTDHHWTSRGAYAAYAIWMENIGQIPFAEADFVVKTAADDFYGTMNAKVNIKTIPDSIEYYEPASNTLSMEKSSQTVYYDRAEEGFDSLYSRAALNTKDKYAFFLGGNYGQVTILTHLPSAERNLLIIKDSYANCFVPFASLHFEKTVLIDLRYNNMPVSQIIEEENITDVLVLYSTKNFAEDKNIYKLLK